MTYFLTALTNDRARLIVSETRTTCAEIAALVRAEIVCQGHILVEWQEG